MQSIQIERVANEDRLVTALWELNCLGIQEQDDVFLAFFADGTDLSSLFQEFVGHVHTFDPTIQQQTPELPDSDLVLAGNRFVIVHSGYTGDLPQGRTALPIDAQAAFGSGRHESTQLVIASLEQHLHTGSTMVDVGSGSGILAAAAVHLGVALLLCCDTHLDAALLTRHHVPRAHVFAGSVDAIASATADLVVANISARVIDRLAYHLQRVLKPDGVLILSGFVKAERPKRFTPVEETELNDWLCWVCRPASTLEAARDEYVQPFQEEWW